jgi:hypothetical protein
VDHGLGDSTLTNAGLALIGFGLFVVVVSAFGCLAVYRGNKFLIFLVRLNYLPLFTDKSHKYAFFPLIIAFIALINSVSTLLFYLSTQIKQLDINYITPKYPFYTNHGIVRYNAQR